MLILTTLYNCELFIEKCLQSIMAQSYSNYKCYIMDDMSTDNSVAIVEKIIQHDERFLLIKNKEKLYQPGNYDKAIRYNTNIQNDEVVVEVDGDDWLSDVDVLSRINFVYSDKEIWLANGSFSYSNGSLGFARPPKDFNNIRSEIFTASHIRTWRAFLWRAIDEDYLKDDKGKYWEVAGDLAFMFPMLEMSGPEHYVFMKEINYIYNEQNPLNDHKVNRTSVEMIANQIRNRHKYNRLTVK